MVDVLVQFLHPSTCPGRLLECSIMLVCTASVPSSSVKLQAQIHGHVVARKIVQEVFSMKIKELKLTPHYTGELLNGDLFVGPHRVCFMRSNIVTAQQPNAKSPPRFVQYSLKTKLPSAIAPTFIGDTFRHYYALTLVVTDDANQSIVSRTFPFNVSLAATQQHSGINALAIATPPQLQLSPPRALAHRSQFAQHSAVTLVRSESFFSSFATPTVSQAASSRGGFNIMVGGGTLGRFYLFKSTYAPAESVVGSFHFAQGTIRCMRVACGLLLHEQVVGTDIKTEKAVAASTQLVRDTRFTSFQLTIPSPAAFTTDLVKVSYSLRFQFLTTVQDANTPGLAKPASLRTSDWTVPLTVKRMLPAPIEDELAP